MGPAVLLLAAWAAPDGVPPAALGPRPLGFDFRRADHVGVGVTVGTGMFGLSVKSLLTRRDGLQVNVGVTPGTYTYWPRAGLGLSADYLHHPDVIWRGSHLGLGWNLGASVSARLTTEANTVSAVLGVGAVGGIEVLLQDVPIDITFEYRPAILLALERPSSLSFAYGEVQANVRWWF